MYQASLSNFGSHDNLSPVFLAFTSELTKAVYRMLWTGRNKVAGDYALLNRSEIIFTSNSITTTRCEYALLNGDSWVLTLNHTSTRKCVDYRNHCMG